MYRSRRVGPFCVEHCMMIMGVPALADLIVDVLSQYVVQCYTLHCELIVKP